MNQSIFEDFLLKLKLFNSLERATVVFLHGDLGSGKTTFTKNLCKYLNLNIDIHSPTFIILKKYPFEVENYKNLIHIDAYRLNSFDDLEKIKIYDYLADKNNLIFIEWPEVVVDEKLKSDIDIYFDHIDENNRKIKIG